MLRDILCVACGGAIGSLLRYGVGNLFAHYVPSHFPWAILLVNVLGCFIIGGAGHYFVVVKEVSEAWRLLLMTGLLGGLTTFSTFGLDTFHLWEQDRAGFALANVVANLLGGLAAVWLGAWAMRTFYIGS